MMVCIICKNPIVVWSDYCRGFGAIELCYDDYIFCYPGEIKLFVKCPRCSNVFMKKQTWQKICFDCWRVENGR